jgi:hypothetical protein
MIHMSHLFIKQNNQKFQSIVMFLPAIGVTRRAAIVNKSSIVLLLNENRFERDLAYICFYIKALLQR